MNSISDVYKWIPISLASKILRRGLSFSPASTFKDVTEFSVNYRPMQAEELLSFMRRVEQDTGVISKERHYIEAMFNNPTYRQSFLQQFNGCGHKFQNDLKEALTERFFVCSLTYDPKEDFDWSDLTGKSNELVRFTLNNKELHQHYKNMYRRVNYVSNRPAINQTAPLEQCAYDIIFTKLNTYEAEKEVRVVLCSDQLKVPCEQLCLLQENNEPYIYDLHLHDYLKAISIAETADTCYIEEWEEILNQQQSPDQQIELYEQVLPYVSSLKYPPPSPEQILLPTDRLSDSERAFYEYYSAFKYFSSLHTKQVIDQIYGHLNRQKPVSTDLVKLFSLPRYNKIPITRFKTTK